MTQTVSEKVAANAYTTTLPTPRAADFQQVYVYSKGKVIVDGKLKAEVTAQENADWRSKGYTIETVDNQQALAKARSDRADDMQRLRDQFKADLEDENGMTGHPKADKVFNKAWDDGDNMQERVDQYEALAQIAL